MPYISKEQIAKIRVELKKEFPAFKFSVTRQHFSSVHVALMSGNIDFGVGYQQVNHYYIKDNYKGDAEKVLSGVNKIASSGCGIESEDGDYGTIPDFYVNISIGQWDKPYKFEN